MQVQSMTRLERQNKINFLLLTSPYVCPYLVCYLMITSRVLNLNELVASQKVMTESTTDLPIAKFLGYKMFAGLPPSPPDVTRDQPVTPPSPLDDRPVDFGSLDKVSRQSLSVDEECGLCNSKCNGGRFTDTGMPPIVLTLCKHSFHQSCHVIWTFNTKRTKAIVRLAGGVSMTRREG